MAEITVDKNRPTPVYQQIAGQIREGILRRELLYDFKLPSERALAARLGVHRNTVRKAYARLMDDGLVEVFAQRDYRVAYGSPGGEAPRRSLSWEFLANRAFLQPANLYDQMIFKSLNKGTISFAAEIASLEVCSDEILAGLLQRQAASSHREEMFGYAPTKGLPALRQALCALLEQRHIYTSPGDIQVFTEATQILRYLISIFLSPGDCVVLEEPFYPDVYILFRDAGVRVVPIPMDEQGMEVDLLEGLIAKYHPKFIYTIPTFNNPAKGVLSLERRYQLLHIAHKTGTPVIEEDLVSDLRYTGQAVPALKALDRNNLVIYIDSFINTFVPGVRVAYAVAPRFVLEKCGYLLVRDTLQNDGPGQFLAAEYLQSGWYAQNLARLRRHYSAKLNLLCRLLEQAGPGVIRFQKPEGGLGLWCRLEDYIDQNALLEAAERRGVLFMPGRAFFPRGAQRGNYIRLNHTYPSLEDIRAGVPLLLKALAEVSAQKG